MFFKVYSCQYKQMIDYLLSTASPPISILTQSQTAIQLSMCTCSMYVCTFVHFRAYMCLLISWLNLLGSLHHFSTFPSKRACIQQALNNCMLMTMIIVMQGVRYSTKCHFSFAPGPLPPPPPMNRNGSTSRALPATPQLPSRSGIDSPRSGPRPPLPPDRPGTGVPPPPPPSTSIRNGFQDSSCEGEVWSQLLGNVQAIVGQQLNGRCVCVCLCDPHCYHTAQH